MTATFGLLRKVCCGCLFMPPTTRLERFAPPAPEHPGGDRHRSRLPRAPLLSSARPRPGQIRDAAPGSARGLFSVTTTTASFGFSRPVLDAAQAARPKGACRDLSRSDLVHVVGTRCVPRSCASSSRYVWTSRRCAWTQLAERAVAQFRVVSASPHHRASARATPKIASGATTSSQDRPASSDGPPLM